MAKNIMVSTLDTGSSGPVRALARAFVLLGKTCYMQFSADLISHFRLVDRL